jgi:hypothetical protein
MTRMFHYLYLVRFLGDPAPRLATFLDLVLLVFRGVMSLASWMTLATSSSVAGPLPAKRTRPRSSTRNTYPVMRLCILSTSRNSSTSVPKYSNWLEEQRKERELESINQSTCPSEQNKHPSMHACVPVQAYRIFMFIYWSIPSNNGSQYSFQRPHRPTLSN